MSSTTPAPKLQVALYRGLTHGEFAIMPDAPIGRYVGNWVREHLSEKEFIPEGYRWNPITKVRTYNYAHWELRRLFAEYNHKTNRLHVPIAFCDNIKEVIEKHGGVVPEFVLPSYPLHKLNVKMNPKFKDRPKQVDPIKRCTNAPDGMLGLNLNTGVGKTYCAVRTAVARGYCTLIIVPGLVNQWIDDIDEYTDADRGRNIHKIEGFDSLAILAKNPNYRPDFFVASTRTMQMFSNGDEGYDVLPWTYAGFLKEYGIGTKVIDECHKQFHANTMMDLKSNVPFNLYLSATFDQTSKQRKAIFDKIYPQDLLIGNDNYDRYVKVQFFNYYGEIDDRRCVKSKGYMHVMYETEMLKSQQRFKSHMHSIIDPLFNQYYVNEFKPGHKCLIFCSTIEFVEAVVEHLKALNPDLKIIAYVGGSERSELQAADVAVSTIGKASTGLDWKGLHCCINTVSVRSPVLTSQMLGRLRKINGEQLVYVDLCDYSMSAPRRHAETRKHDLIRMAAVFDEYYGVMNANLVAHIENTAVAPRV